MYAFALTQTLFLLSLVNAAPMGRLDKRDTDLNPSRCPDFCAGTTRSGDVTQFVCGDPRLGPVALPTGIPLAAVAGSASTYHRFGGLCPGDYLAKWTGFDGLYVYPGSSGFALDTAGRPMAGNLTLSAGTLLDRFGSEYGSFMSPAGAPYAQRALPPTNLNAASGAAYPFNYHVYAVARPLVVLAGPIAPWFGQPAMGVQFQMLKAVGGLVDDGYLVKVNTSALGE
ncbi:hypothetical protein EJ06DRAFT_526545 [Trichodelitschia bisporula]|uniref:TNT domain-containing protein n=1 Tax=Trichodelitschia bisporula TaxID=703511 RepID=A0A6G1I8Z9_9PEZI|nr:hypothetical protein EJ06DRAFT_526545 [Trichodelitschia bisporula]